MKTITPNFIAAALVYGALLSVMAGPTFGQTSSTTANATEQVLVGAPRYVIKTRSALGGNSSMITVSQTVMVADLSLSDPQGASELRNRVNEAAKGVCGKLEERYPSSKYPDLEDKDCVKSATEGAMVQVDQVVAPASKR